MKKLFVIVASVLLLANVAFAGYYRVFYYVRGEQRDRPYAGSVTASSPEEARRIVLKKEPNAYRIEVSLQQ